MGDRDREKIYAEYDDVVSAIATALEQFDTEKLRRVADEAERRGGGWLAEMIRGYLDAYGNSESGDEQASSRSPA